MKFHRFYSPQTKALFFFILRIEEVPGPAEQEAEG